MDRPRRTKANKRPVQEIELPHLEKKPPTGDFYKDTYPSSASEVDEDSDCSDYGKRSNKRKSTSKHASKSKGPAKKKVRVREPSPELSELSDIDSEDDREEDLPLFTKQTRVAPPVKATLTSKVLKLEIRTPMTIHVNLTDLFPNKVGINSEDLNGDTLLDSVDDTDTRLTIADESRDSIKKLRHNPKYASFLELEPGLRNQVYRQYLTTDSVVKFHPAPRGGRETAILRVCKQVYEEGRGMLYGGNAFHFERVNQTRGRYFDNERREVGYKDVRRFLETIGSHNIAKMRYLSIDFSDAVPTFTSYMLPEERRFVNDPVLIYILKMIGRSGVTLDKFVVDFAGRAEVTSNDIAFVRALTSISCHSLVKTCVWGHSRISTFLFPKIKAFMTTPQINDINEERRKGPKMEHQGRHSSWRCSHSSMCS